MSKHTTEPVEFPSDDWMAGFKAGAAATRRRLGATSEGEAEALQFLEQATLDLLARAPTAPSEDVRDAPDDLLQVLAEHPRWQLDCEVLKFGVPGKWRVWSLKGNPSHSTAVRVHGEGATPAEALRAALAAGRGE